MKFTINKSSDLWHNKDYEKEIIKSYTDIEQLKKVKENNYGNN